MKGRKKRRRGREGKGGHTHRLHDIPKQGLPSVTVFFHSHPPHVLVAMVCLIINPQQRNGEPETNNKQTKPQNKTIPSFSVVLPCISVIAIKPDLNVSCGDSNVNGCSFIAGSGEESPDRADNNLQEVPGSIGNCQVPRGGRGVTGKEASTGSKHVCRT